MGCAGWQLLSALPAYAQTGKALWSAGRFVQSMHEHYQCVKKTSGGGTGQDETVISNEPERGGEEPDEDKR